MPSFVKETIESEKFAISILAQRFNDTLGNFNHVNLKSMVSPFDFEWKDKKFDSKYSNPGIVSKGRKLMWNFDLQWKAYMCDYLVLIGMIDKRPNKVFLVPSCKAPIRNLRIPFDGKSKWFKYQIWSS